MKKLIALLALSIAAVSPVMADSAFNPTKPVKIVVPFPPGGGTDAFSRILGEKLGQMWKQQVIVENRGGAQGNVGTAYGAKAPADGYTLVLAHQGAFTVNPYTYQDVGFDPIKDFIPVSRGTQQPFVLVANPGMNVKNLKEFIAYAKTQPGKLSYGSSASGPQLTGEMFKAVTGVDMLHVAYKGAGPGIVDVLAGHINLFVANPTSVAPHVRSGKLIGLVMFGPDGVAVLPDTPTAAQAGFPELGKMPEWYGLAVPAGTPPKVVEQLNKDITTALNDPGVKGRLNGLGLNASPSTPKEFADQIQRDLTASKDLVKKAGLTSQ
ncbi:tripartite tricarboxylate transporter substrate binding protein [Zwartia sp.]|uniref:Bug family tripartite tricarboxylate transporter substrate binding protein n=1 Tax=Zwartia sp. TaxID=2978004 RepID=UPI00271F8CFE|nr:tripartite tricarboxylate transporter substrate binding protein [Zwartia sp.]MDO9025959.1 tripartite tricarboxylate transporter substrate binding protein [Zwartia sp.]